jgi:hypothetical protein
MIFTATQLDDAWLINLELREDEPGFFARNWCRQELAAQGLDRSIKPECPPRCASASGQAAKLTVPVADSWSHANSSLKSKIP